MKIHVLVLSSSHKEIVESRMYDNLSYQGSVLRNNLVRDVMVLAGMSSLQALTWLIQSEHQILLKILMSSHSAAIYCGNLLEMLALLCLYLQNRPLHW